MLFPAAGGAATITPDVLTDDFTPNADCSLREAIQVANSDNAAVEDDCGVAGTLGTDAISLAAGTYQLGPDPSFDEDGTPDDNAQGDLDVNGPLTLDGQAANLTTINSSLIMPTVRVLHAIGGPVSIEELTVTGGHPTAGADGGGIASNAGVSVTLLRSAVSMNSAEYGGGVFAMGPLTVTDTTVSTNTATEDGGGIDANGGVTVNGTSVISGNDGKTGGGIASAVSLPPFTISGNVVVTGNDATTAGSGGGIFLNTSNFNPTISGATISDNTAVNVGGGVFFNSLVDDTLTISDTTLNGNLGENGGGGLFLQDDSALTSLRVFDNDAGELVDDAVNEGIGGGGIFSYADSTVTDSWIHQNEVAPVDLGDSPTGGGIASDTGTITIRRTTVSANELTGGAGRFGAGIHNGGTGSAQIENSTVSDNTINGAGSGGGLDQSPGTTSMTIVHSTVAGNTATTGPGINSNGALTLAGSIIAQGATGCAGGGVYTANAYNVDQGSSCVGAADDTDLEGTDPLLGGLLANGGPTPTRLPAANGPAVDAVPAAACDDLLGAPLALDQRGLPRPDDGNGNAVFDCEAGAVELQVSGPPVVNPPAANTPGSTTKKCKKKRKKKGKAVAGAKKKKKKCKNKRRKKK